MASDQEKYLQIAVAAEIPKEDGGFVHDRILITGDSPETRELLDFYMSIGSTTMGFVKKISKSGTYPGLRADIEDPEIKLPLN